MIAKAPLAVAVGALTLTLAVLPAAGSPGPLKVGSRHRSAQRDDADHSAERSDGRGRSADGRVRRARPPSAGAGDHGAGRSLPVAMLLLGFATLGWR